MFFTKWGPSKPRLERANLDGIDQKTLVDQKIVYPYGLTIDFPLQHVYWVDTYLDYIDRVDYDGNNRKTVRKGYPVSLIFWFIFLCRVLSNIIHQTYSSRIKSHSCLLIYLSSREESKVMIV